MSKMHTRQDFSRLFGVDVLWRLRWITSGMGLSPPPGWDNISPDVKIGEYYCLKSEKRMSCPNSWNYAESEKVTFKQQPSTKNFFVFWNYCWHNGEIWSRWKCKILFFCRNIKQIFPQVKILEEEAEISIPTYLLFNSFWNMKEKFTYA